MYIYAYRIYVKCIYINILICICVDYIMFLPFYNRQKFVQYMMLFGCRWGMLYVDFQFGVHEKYSKFNGATVVVLFVGS
jgi:hypothetical protein